MITNKEYQEAEETIFQFKIEAQQRTDKEMISGERQDEILRILKNYVPNLEVPDGDVKPICVAIEYLCQNYKKP